MKEFVFYVLLIFLVNIHGLFHWKIKKGTEITNAFQKVLDESNCKSNKILADKGSEFYNGPMKSWLQDNNIDNEGKSVVAERFIRTLKNKIYKYMTSISKNVNIDKLDDIVNKCNNTDRTIKKKPVDVKQAYILTKNNKEGLKFKVGGNVRI